MGRRVITKKDLLLMENKQKSILKAAEGISTDAAALKAQPDEDDYASRVAKYIPAEIIAGFIAIDGILKAVSDPPAFLYWLVFAFCLVLTPFYTWRISNQKDLPTAISQIVISTCSFACWVFAFGGPFKFFDWYQPYIGSILLVMATLLFPLFTNINDSGNTQAPSL